MRKFFKTAVSMLLCLALMMSLSVAAFAESADNEEDASAVAADTENELGSITVSCPADGANVRLWRIGTTDSSGSITLTGGFTAFSAYVNPNSKYAAATLSAMASGKIAPQDKSATSDGSVGFSGLEKGTYLIYVADAEKDGMTYRCSPFIFTLPFDDGTGNLSMNVQAEVKYECDKTTGSMAVYKAWTNDVSNKRPDSITVEICCNGAVRNTVTLSEKNDWFYSWNTEGETDWTVREVSVPDGYSLQITRADYGWKITNIGSDKPPEKLPQTGLLWWPVPLLICLGLASLTVGIIRRKRS